MVETTGEITYVYQSDYDEDPTGYSKSIVKSSVSKGLLFTDSLDNLFLMTQTSLYAYDDEMASIGSKSLLQMNTAAGHSAVPGDLSSSLSVLQDKTNDYLYFGNVVNNGSSYFFYILRIDSSLTMTLIHSETLTDGTYIVPVALSEDCTEMYFLKGAALRKISDIGEAGQAISTIYTFGANQYPTFSLVNNTWYQFSFGSILDNTLYYLFDDAGTSLCLGVLSNLDTTPVLVTADTGIGCSVGTSLIVSSATEVYFAYVQKIKKATLSAGMWTFSNAASYTDSTTSVIRQMAINADSEFVVADNDSIKVYDSSWTHVRTIYVGIAVGDFVNYQGTGKNSYIYFIIDSDGGDFVPLYRVFTGGYWQKYVDEEIDTETADPTMAGVVAKIISNYCDLNVANDKRVSRVYLDGESEYATVGAFSLESDYNVNRYIHVDEEITEPSGAVSRQAFGNAGQRSWDIDYSFDGTVEAWMTNRIDVATQGQSFRYSIKIGDVPNANHGSLRIRPPMIDCQVRGKLNG